MQREQVLEQALGILELNGLAATTSLAMMAEELGCSEQELQRFWPDRDALLYDALRYHGQQIEVWRRKLLLDDSLSPQKKLMARYQVLAEAVNNQRYPGCLFIAACSFYPQPDHPIHEIAELQKQASWQYTHALLSELETDNPELVAHQMELILEGCLSRLLVKRKVQEVENARRLAEDVLTIALCRKNGALS
ncbi:MULTISPECIES: division control transcriptional repressor DicD [Erwinia]|uniref:TetR family transcriptional regulator n=1 Tax=Erwinia rhapontici TaxID=55212 RepID=A0ABN6DQ71_ERWRD|nr:transcriptional regulator [Erwinia rhapontici]NNS08201.1 transcriptional regulator [Erwinia sp. JH02]MBP2152932.1 AcrR family transcriptional regulator [Erwinia rhapontici]MCS3608275.1 AcrR family transcriptional regulator [Erwinia rhapontici]NKG31601.1 transcriptional regulator [Erwinia rhapontici]TDT00745.1 AcrR family transcriptional regulator [Erwinia rhapontici]